MAVAWYLLQETSFKFSLEDDSGALLLDRVRLGTWYRGAPEYAARAANVQDATRPANVQLVTRAASMQCTTRAANMQCAARPANVQRPEMTGGWRQH